MRLLCLKAVLLCLAGFGWARPASAQVLIWSLPKQDGAWVKYEGTYHTKVTLGDNDLRWRTELTIKSVGREMVEFEGRRQPARWLEFKSVTGQASEQGIQPGPYGTRIYKILVPESHVVDKPFDAGGIAVTYLPVVRGYRKIGDREPAALAEHAFAPYPIISLVNFHADLAPEGAPAEMQLPLGDVRAQEYRGTRTIETGTSRTSNEVSLWRSATIPFELARYQVRVQRDEKDVTAGPDEFKPAAEISVEVSAAATGDDARSELPEQR